jgi:integral membrane sensor domain MASE1
MKKLGKYIAVSTLTALFVGVVQPQAKALVLDTVRSVLINCVLRDIPALGSIVDIFVWGVRILFVVAIAVIVYILWSKRNDNENIQDWTRILAFIVLGAAIIGGVENFFLGSAQAAQSSCAATAPTTPGGSGNGGVPPVPGQ